MTFAAIRSTITAPTAKPAITSASRDDLEIGDTVLLNSVNAGTSYVWSLAYAPEGSAATFSGSVFNQSPGSFTIDKEGPYLIRLVMSCPTVRVMTSPIVASATLKINGVTLTAISGPRTPGADNFNGSLGNAVLLAAEIADAINDPVNSFTSITTAEVDPGSDVVRICPVVSGSPLTIVSSAASMLVSLGATSEQFVRLRALTTYGSLKLVSAGERVDTVPIPVDITFTGWADEQNFNLLTLLRFTQATASSGRVLHVDPITGDHQTIQAAMDAAQAQSPTFAHQWVVLVRPGLYVEDLTFYPFVHVFGWPGGKTEIVTIRNASTSHTAVMAMGGDQLTLSNLHLELIPATASPAFLASGAGTVSAHEVVFLSGGAGAPQGPSYEQSGSGSFLAFNCRFVSSPAASPESFSMSISGSVTARVRRSRFVHRGIWAQAGTTLALRDCEVDSNGSSGIRSEAALVEIDYCTFEGTPTLDLAFNPSGSVLAGSLIGRVRWSRLRSIQYDVTGVGGATELTLGASEYSTLTLPGGPPTSFGATTPALTIFYDHTASGIVAKNVQGALDEIFTIASAVQTLDNAYNGGNPGVTGSGRTINASAGAVQIVDASSPSDPIPPSNPNGNLEVVGGIYTGALSKPEQSFDPNPYGNGPLILQGREIWASDAPFGSSSLWMANATGSPTFFNYTWRGGTMSADGGGQVGRAIFRAGDSLAAGVNAGSVFIQSGRGSDAAGGDGGDIFIAPGDSANGADGRVWLVRGQDGTPATLTAALPFSGGITGRIRFGTDMGSVEISVDAGDNLAAVLSKFNATGIVSAVDSGGGVLQIITASTGATSEIFFLNADVGVDTSLGQFAGQSQVNGAWPSLIDVEASANGEITFGASFANPMIYDAVTGKLTVPGLIDPIGLVLEQTSPQTAGLSKGVLYVEDGSGPGTVGDLLFVYETGAVQNISSVIGGSTGFVVKDENTLLPNGPHTTLNFVGAGVTVSDVGGGVADVTITGTGGSGILAGVEQEVFTAGGFTAAFPGSLQALTQTYDTTTALAGLVICYRNGVADMNNVGPAVPANALEYRIHSNQLEIGADITATANTYRLVYPTV